MTSEELFQRHTPWAEGIARTHCLSLPPSFDVDDLIQAALIALWKATEKYDCEYGVPFRLYAITFVRNACRMQTRRREYKERTMDELPDTMEAPAAKRPDNRVIREETEARAVRQLQELSAKQRAVVQGLYWESDSLRRLAQKLSSSAANIAHLRDDALEIFRAAGEKKRRKRAGHFDARWAAKRDWTGRQTDGSQ